MTNEPHEPGTLVDVKSGADECAVLRVPHRPCSCGSRFVHFVKIPSRIIGRDWRAVEARCSGCCKALARAELAPFDMG